MRLSLVLWDGNVGGGEKVTAELAGALRSIGVDATVVFVRDPAALATDLERLDVPYVSLGARRVEEVLWRPRRFARLVEAHGPDGALLPAVGHQAPALRIGGYRAPLVAVEHGFLLMMDSMAPHWRFARRLERRLSAPFLDAEVAVSDFMRSEVMRVPRARRVERIHNGIDVARYRPEPTGAAGSCMVGCAGRLVHGKGIDTLIEGFRTVLNAAPQTRLRIAGEGPEHDRIRGKIEQHRLVPAVELVGVVDDMPAFWSDIDVGVLPSTLPESFGMVTLEAMASGSPVVATRCGGAAELVEDGLTGTLVPPGDAGALGRALLSYVSDPDLRQLHGQAGRTRCELDFTMERCATAYARLLAEVGQSELPSPAPVEPALEEVGA